MLTEVAVGASLGGDAAGAVKIEVRPPGFTTAIPAAPRQ